MQTALFTETLEGQLEGGLEGGKVPSRQIECRRAVGLRFVDPPAAA